MVSPQSEGLMRDVKNRIAEDFGACLCSWLFLPVLARAFGSAERRYSARRAAFPCRWREPPEPACQQKSAEVVVLTALEDKTPDTYSPFPVQLMEFVVDESNMLKAWSKVKANKGAPASHPSSPNTDLRSGFLGIELRLPTKTLCTRSHQTSPTSYPLWIPTLC